MASIRAFVSFLQSSHASTVGLSVTSRSDEGEAGSCHASGAADVPCPLGLERRRNIFPNSFLTRASGVMLMPRLFGMPPHPQPAVLSPCRSSSWAEGNRFRPRARVVIASSRPLTSCRLPFEPACIKRQQTWHQFSRSGQVSSPQVLQSFFFSPPFLFKRRLPDS